MHFQAGKLSEHVDKWRAIGASDFVLQCITKGVQFKFKCSPQSFSYENHKLSFTQARFIDSEINDLVRSGALRKVNFIPTCVSPVGCVKKKGNKWRLITDLRHLNQCVEAPKFQYEDISYMKNIVKPGDHFITWDLHTGFHHIPVHESLQTYLGIKWRNNYYVWTVLPFGLNASPYYFCKITRAFVNHLRDLGLRIGAYVDDGCLAAQPRHSFTQKGAPFYFR